MPKYQIVIGGRELIVEGPSVADAQEAAMNAYPGEAIQSTALIREEPQEPGESPPGGE